VRTSILLWSTASGIILGIFFDATLIGVALLLSAVFPSAINRLNHRWFVALSTVVLVSVPIFLAVLGYLEGELKAT
jgi:hypothetical protein